MYIKVMCLCSDSIVGDSNVSIEQNVGVRFAVEFMGTIGQATQGALSSGISLRPLASTIAQDLCNSPG